MIACKRGSRTAVQRGHLVSTFQRTHFVSCDSKMFSSTAQRIPSFCKDCVSAGCDTCCAAFAYTNHHREIIMLRLHVSPSTHALTAEQLVQPSVNHHAVHALVSLR